MKNKVTKSKKGVTTFPRTMHNRILDINSVHLTPMESRLLSFLLDNPNNAFSRSELLSRVWNIKEDQNTRTVDVHIAHLRRKLGLSKNIGVKYKYGYFYIPCGKQKTDKLVALITNHPKSD